MSATLFAPASPVSEASTPAPVEMSSRYLSLSTPAVLSLVVAIFSPLAFLDSGFGAIGIVAILLGFRGLREVRRRPLELTGTRYAKAGIILAAFSVAGGWSYLGYVYATEVPPDHVRISYNDLRDNPLDPDLVPSQRALELNGQKVFIKGYIYPQAEKRMRRFLLCRDNGTCCFGGMPKLSDVLLVELSGKEPLAYSPYQHKIAGTLRVQRISPGKAGGEDGAVSEVVYQLVEASVR